MRGIPAPMVPMQADEAPGITEQSRATEQTSVSRRIRMSISFSASIHRTCTACGHPVTHGFILSPRDAAGPEDEASSAPPAPSGMFPSTPSRMRSRITVKPASIRSMPPRPVSNGAMRPSMNGSAASNQRPPRADHQHTQDSQAAVQTPQR